MHIQRNVKAILKRDGTTSTSGIEMKVGKLKSTSSKREVPLNETAIAMIEDLRREAHFGEETPLVCNENGGYIMPEYFRNSICCRLRQRDRTEFCVKVNKILPIRYKLNTEGNLKGVFYQWKKRQKNY